MKRPPSTKLALDWLSMGYAGVWLIFLVFPALSLWSAPQFSQGQKIFATGLFVFFCLLYLASYGINTILPAPSQTVRTLWWSLIVALPVLALSFFIGA